MTIDKKRLLVAESLTGQRLDVGLTTAGAAHSRSQAQKLIQDHKVWVNGKIEKASYRLQTGDSIDLEIPQPKKMTLIPYDFPLDIIFEDLLELSNNKKIKTFF